ncbi:MAG: methyltransferase domain-containing protein [Gemmataceae bacterium]
MAVVELPPGEKAAGLPEYDALQSAFHQTCREELYRVIDRLRLPADASVLDAPCGNGFYAARLAARVGAGGRVALVDANRTYLDQARAAVAEITAHVEVTRADVYHLPYPDATFDLVWCAQSLISLKDPPRVLREFLRVAKPNGRLVVLEADEFHHVLLPWPVGLELAVQQAVHLASRERPDGPSLAPARTLRRMLSTAGWGGVRKRTVACDRQAPLEQWELDFLTRHLTSLHRLARGHLPADVRDRFDRLIDPAEPGGLLRRPDLEFTCLNTLYLARKPQ